MCQHLEDMHYSLNEYFPITNAYSYKIMHDEGPFKMQERLMDFNITEF